MPTLTLTPAGRKLALTAHVTSSVGWLGSVLAFLGLSVAGLASDDGRTVRSVYVAMEATGWYVLVPLSTASLLTGLVQSLGTPWGLFRHYWVVAMLVINAFATMVLVLYMQTLTDLASIANDPGADLHRLRSASPLVHASFALVLLVVATVLSIYKPRGLTRHGQRQLRREVVP